MAKATKSSTRIPKLAEDPRDQISPEVAGKMLIPHFGDVHIARTRLDDAICQNRVASYADGVRVQANYFASCMTVTIAHNTTDQFDIFPFAGPHSHPYTWTVSRKDVLALTEGDEPVDELVSRRGGKTKINWDLFTAEFVRRVYEDGSPTDSDKDLADDLLLWGDGQRIKPLPESDTLQRKLKIWRSRLPRGN